MAGYDVVLIHPPSLYDFRREIWFPRPHVRSEMGFEWENRKSCLCDLRKASRFSAALILISIVAALPIATVKAQDLMFEKTWGGVDNDVGQGVAVDSSGNIYVAGTTDSFRPGGVNVFLLQYGPSGNLQWQKKWGGGYTDGANAIAVGCSGDIYLTGSTRSDSRALSNVSGIETTPTGGETTPIGIEATPTGTENTPIGIKSTPSGNETYAGQADVFLLKLSTPTPAPVNKLAVLAPYLVLVGLVGIVAMVIALKGRYGARTHIINLRVQI